ncbi:ATP-binding protein [Paracoccus sp. Z118]|uniref:AAA family ATPase n=1 Tax=Paracoccus sp. Z118 TaxID=2851017 RepID=UPI001C2C65F1|nr:AAA family ATPase [Paracoccus sp. Z118]MBV0892180.1 ATP-binding protein [Paracoccus sp. Z118]
MLDDALRPDSRARSRRVSGFNLVYIEEPEAHLFPRAQARLLDFLISSVLNERRSRRLILTTHSPYVMTRMNVYLKAGQLARRKKRNQEINDIIPRACWIGRDQLAAWAIRDGEFVSLIDEDGMIDSEYLDGISDIMAEEYSRLLDVEETI